jgi:hypothetical protein
MANSISVQGSLQITADGATARGSKSVSITQSGTNWRQNVQEVSTGTETMETGDLSDIRYCYIQNPAAGATLTVTMAAAVLKPGDVMVFAPSTNLVTLQATGAVNANILAVEA